MRLGKLYTSEPEIRVGGTGAIIAGTAGDRIESLSCTAMRIRVNEDPFETYMAFAEDLNERLGAYEGLIRAVSLERGIRHNIGIAFDELGVWRGPGNINRNAPIKRDTG